MGKRSLDSKSIVAALAGHRSEIRRLGVRRIGLFGSFLKGRHTSKSDIDFLVKFERPTFDSYMDLKFMLERLFGKRADVVMEESIKPSLRYVKNEALYVRL